ncbi:hypothetical protein SDRG_02192 [Saprolegnia diclina VS20]|uniref:AAA+ ATPase domain-containing protein n=1 Tax=Saprolegnia diclina (strain VS20) TaxID=1156394 RepID=T0R1S3_SAPDV|nr:hypothetical protein SDRG_02192 [Saprolegnia diclina VS20]EQC40290.1 hypothetical protein SDRG_02192 [Saprolegnia diclina VS20]|eukprot:XP_008605989.1 hypothetical protein SDRG_02192 [Saprolegnia diclina VS20]
MESQMMQLGMFSSMRANKTETLMCILLPIVLKQLYDSAGSISLSDLVDNVLSALPFGRRSTLRVISAKHYMASHGRIYDESDMNYILQRAIANYLTKHMPMAHKPSGRYQLVEALDTEVVSRLGDDAPNPNDRDYWDTRELDVDVTILTVNALPPIGEWIEIEDGLWFYHDVYEAGESGGGNGSQRSMKESTITFKLRASGADAGGRIDSFVNTAFQAYQDAIVAKKLRDKTRYMYVASAGAPPPVATSSEDDGGASTPSAPLFKRYALSDHKTFDNLFFETKTALLDLLDTFTTKSGKYAIQGFPYKLGFLLHGPPGTGKTSLIKAIAQHTKRHIVNISLANVKTNQELMDYMLDLRMNVPGEDMPIKLSYDKVVFVMEDIDCASEVVHTRKDSATGVPSDDEDRAMLEAAVAASLASAGGIKSMTKFTPHDKLNLSGLLNVLDGVVDTPGRILIMTSNHPEKLDPALIRPGRIDEQLYMGAMNATQATLMVQHYFATALTTDETATIERVFTNATTDISPAQVENLCAKHRQLDDFLVALKDQL